MFGHFLTLLCMKGLKAKIKKKVRLLLKVTIKIHQRSQRVGEGVMVFTGKFKQDKLFSTVDFHYRYPFDLERQKNVRVKKRPPSP